MCAALLLLIEPFCFRMGAKSANGLTSPPLAPSRKGCVVNGQKTKASNKWVRPSPSRLLPGAQAQPCRPALAPSPGAVCLGSYPEPCVAWWARGGGGTTHASATTAVSWHSAQPGGICVFFAWYRPYASGVLELVYVVRQKSTEIHLDDSMRMFRGCNIV